MITNKKIVKIVRADPRQEMLDDEGLTYERDNRDIPSDSRCLFVGFVVFKLPLFVTRWIRKEGFEMKCIFDLSDHN